MDERARQFRVDLLTWAERHIRDFPWRDPDTSFYEVFIAEFFLTQTPAENVDRLFPDFVDKYPSLDAIQAVDEDELASDIEPIGFHNMRAEALKSIAAQNDSLPRDPEELQELQRVGDYVANATVCFACNEPLAVLDRNVNRVYERLFGDDWPESRSEQETAARTLVPDKNPRRYNLALIDFGAKVCTTEPRCSACFAPEYCAYYRKATE